MTSDPNAASFTTRHHALIAKHATAQARAIPGGADSLAPEDIAREIEMEVRSFARLNDVDLDIEANVPSPDAFVRSLAAHAMNRAKRRRTLIAQVAAGDDLHAVTRELAALERDVAKVSVAPDDAAKKARAAIDARKSKLAAREQLPFALLFEDNLALDDVAAATSLPLAEIERVRDEAIETAAQTERAEQAEADLRALGRAASDATPAGEHLREPLLALLRSGDGSDDLLDAITHAATCASCRAQMLFGESERRPVVVMAIEAPSAREDELHKAALGSRARLEPRGEGRWTAVIPAENSQTFARALGEGESSVVSRLAMAAPVDISLEPVAGGASSVAPPAHGYDAAEMEAWAAVSHAPKRGDTRSPMSFMWLAAALGTIGLSVTIAYMLATR